MRRPLKWALRLVLGLAVLLLIGWILKDPILRIVLERRIRSRTGMDVRIGKLYSGIFSPRVTLRDLRLYNTAEFGGTPFLDAPELHLEFDPVALRHRKLRVTLMRLNLNELDIVRTEAGQTNVVSLLHNVQRHKSGGGGPTKSSRSFQFSGIDVLNLTLGKTKYFDLNDARNNREVSVNFQNQIFKNVRSDSDVYAILFLIWLRSHGPFSAPVPIAGASRSSSPILH